MLISNHTFPCGEAVELNLVFDQSYKLSLWAKAVYFVVLEVSLQEGHTLKGGKLNEIAMCYSKYRPK